MWLRRTLPTVNDKFPFREKLLAVAESPVHRFQPKDAHWAIEMGWDLHLDSYRDRIKSFTEIFEKIDTEWIFYHEEDVAIETMPTHAIMKEMDEYSDEHGRRCGQVSMNAGGSSYEDGPHDMGDLDKARENTIAETYGLNIIKRDENKRSVYFITFPALFIRTSIIRDCHRHACNNYPGEQIERGITRAYFDLGLDRYFFKTSALYPSVYGIGNNEKVTSGPHVPYDVLDPRQGDSPLGGRHVY